MSVRLCSAVLPTLALLWTCLACKRLHSRFILGLGRCGDDVGPSYGGVLRPVGEDDRPGGLTGEASLDGVGGGDFRSSLADRLRSDGSLVTPRPACNRSSLKSCMLVGRMGPSRSLAQLRRSPGGGTVVGGGKGAEAGLSNEKDGSPAQLLLSPGRQRGERDLGLSTPVSGRRPLVLATLFSEDTLNAGELEREDGGDSDRSKSDLTFILFLDWWMMENRSSVDIVDLGVLGSLPTSSGLFGSSRPSSFGVEEAHLVEGGVDGMT